VLFSERASTMRPPASVEKLYTAAALLERLGPEYRLSTTVYGTGHLAPDGVWEGSLYLHGGGDPTFGSSAFIASHYGGVGSPVSALAGQLRAAGIRRVSGEVVGDESIFDSLRGEPSSDYAPDPFLEGSLSALAFNRGATGSEQGARAPAAYAARQLRAALRTDGVRVSGSGGAVTGVPAGAIQLATLPSPTIAQLLGLMLPPSDNFFAEMLVKALGAHLGGAGTTPAGVRVVSATVASLLGTHPRIYDGSGLSEADRTSPSQVADLLVSLYPTPIGALLRARMAVAGRTGTLETRMRKTAAAGRCVGKTGTLTGVSNLVGYCPSSDGHMLAFAIFTDAIGVTAARTFQDHIAITLASSTL
jgi:serine-type D-Ala-D-Ala carboxypeptidase/endopeptidase (penicillin-binding protein 4)